MSIADDIRRFCAQFDKDMPLFLEPSRYAFLKEMGCDMSCFRKIEPIPISAGNIYKRR